MKSSNTGAAIALSLLCLSIAPTMAQKQYQGCYKSVGSMEMAGPWTWQTSDYCLGMCKNESTPAPVLAVQYKSCFCGDELPAGSEKTDDKDCSTHCPGWGQENCGGSDTYSVYINTDLKDAADVPVAGASSSSSSSSAGPTSTAPSQQTVTHTAASDNKDNGGGPNKAAIAAGVVVGVVAVAALAGGAFFFLRYKKRKQIELEYHQNAAVSNFIAGGKPGYGQNSESRFDSSLMSQRRQSNGSIADDQDFSRRILKVTNPDGY